MLADDAFMQERDDGRPAAENERPRLEDEQALRDEGSSTSGRHDQWPGRRGMTNFG